MILIIFPGIHFKCISDVQKQLSNFFSFFLFFVLIISSSLHWDTSVPAACPRVTGSPLEQMPSSWRGEEDIPGKQSLRISFLAHSQSHTPERPGFLNSPPHPCPLLGRPLGHRHYMFALVLAVNFLCHRPLHFAVLPGRPAGSLLTVPQNTALSFSCSALGRGGKIKISKTSLHCSSLLNSQHVFQDPLM